VKWERKVWAGSILIGLNGYTRTQTLRASRSRHNIIIYNLAAYSLQFRSSRISAGTNLWCNTSSHTVTLRRSFRAFTVTLTLYRPVLAYLCCCVSSHALKRYVTILVVRNTHEYFKLFPRFILYAERFESNTKQTKQKSR